MAHDVFVSHSVKDKAVAEAIVTRLEAGSVTCWIAPRDVVPGADWGESIIDAIESSRIMILLFSQSANASPQIKREVERAVNKGVYIIPFRIDDIPPTRALEYFISSSQWMDAFLPPLERHLDNLAKTVKAVLKSPPLPGASAPAQSESESPMKTAQIYPAPSAVVRPSRPPVLPSKSIAVAIALLMLVGGAGWYLGHKREAPPGSRPTQPHERLPIVKPTEAEVASKQPEPIAAQPQGKARPQAIPKIDGIWHDDDYLAVSQITQDGNSFRFTRQGSLANGTRFESSGGGTISGQRFTFTYNARYQTGETSWGECSGSLSADGMRMDLTCRDSLFGAFAVAANHE